MLPPPSSSFFAVSFFAGSMRRAKEEDPWGSRSQSSVGPRLRAERQAPSPETERPEPDRAAPSAERLRRKLEERLERLIEESEADQGNARLEDRMLKVCKVLEFLRGEGDDIAGQLEAMDGFSDFCVRTLSEGEMTPVRKAVRLFLDELKRKHS